MTNDESEKERAARLESVARMHRSMNGHAAPLWAEANKSRADRILAKLAVYSPLALILAILLASAVLRIADWWR